MKHRECDSALYFFLVYKDKVRHCDLLNEEHLHSSSFLLLLFMLGFKVTVRLLGQQETKKNSTSRKRCLRLTTSCRRKLESQSEIK